MALLSFYVSFLFVAKCYGVAEDYYEEPMVEDTTPSSVSVVNNVTIARRTGEKLKQNLLLINKNKTNEYDMDEKEDDFKVFVVSQKKMKPKQSLKYVFNTTQTTLSTKTTAVYEDSTTAIRNKTQNYSLKFLKDYEYIYDDITTLDTQQIQPLLSKHKIGVTARIESSYISQLNDSNVFYADFFNLIPAANMPDNKTNMTYTNVNNEWFVPGMYPCWQLPVLYGELGKRKKTSEIFLTSDANLKNVHVLRRKKIPMSKQYDEPASAIHNKWCDAEPCYGDHTLCLFSDNSVSKICDKNYRITVPTTLEQIALVNTINAMRNRIANGEAEDYTHLPPARNMKQILYDYDLEKMAKAWLRQCLPGPPLCSAIDGHYVTQLECTKYADQCCINAYKDDATSKCIPKDECFVPAVIGCISAWYLSAGTKLQRKDVDCGHIDPTTYNTVQLFWADTFKIGCAHGENANGDVRVVCNFAPGAPFFILTKYYCGFILHKDMTRDVVVSGGESDSVDVTNLTLLSSVGLNLKINPWAKEPPHQNKTDNIARKEASLITSWGLEGINDLYTNAHFRALMKDYSNVTRGMIAKLVTRYSFFEESQSRCDTTEPIYVVGQPGSLCIEKGRRFHGLCYDFRDPTPGYRLAAVIAPVALFSLILYDLFSSVVRQTNY